MRACSGTPLVRPGNVTYLGAIHGMAANAGGTAMTLYLVKMRVSMLAFMGTSAWFFFENVKAFG